MCLSPVNVQDLRDVSGTGRQCQGASCCAAEADICRGKAPWPEVTLHGGTEGEEGEMAAVESCDQGSHTPLCVPYL